MTLTLRYAAKSDRGLIRDGNQDSVYAGPRLLAVADGRISPEEASSHPQRSLLTRALDGRDIDPEYAIRPAVTGDRYLLCSDGLTAVVSAETIAETLREYVDPAQCVERLIQLALR